MRLVPRSPLLNATGDDEEEDEPGYFAIEQEGL